MINRERIIIVSGGNLHKEALEIIEAGDVIVGADRGALFLLRHGIRPDLAIGDFDSVSFEEYEEIQAGSDLLITCDPVMKDYSDTEMAFNWAVERRPESIIMLGALGSRFDHSLASIHLLRKAKQHGIQCKIVDEHNEIHLTDRRLEVRKGHFTACSLLPLTLEVTGITLAGFQYPLNNAKLDMGQSLGVSNVIIDEVAQITIDSGLLLVILSKD